MSSSQTRYNCLINPCGKRKDFSLLTLYEHLCYHLKEKGFLEHFEYKCVPCKAFFTNKVFMVRHKMESGNENHEIQRMPEIDLVNPQNDEKLRRAVQLLSDDYLRYKFKVSSDGSVGVTAAMPGTPGTPKYGDKSLYSPRTPRVLSPFAPGTPRHNEELNRSKDFSNCFANATPSRPLLNPVLQNAADTSALNEATRKLPNFQADMPHQWQVAAIREALGIPITDNFPVNTPSFSNRGFGNNSNNGGSSFQPWERGAGDCSFDRGGTVDRGFDRGGTADRGFDRGGTGDRSFDRGGTGDRGFDRGGTGGKRDFQSNFDSNTSDGFNRSESRRGMGMRGGRGGDRGFRGRGNFRGNDERGRGGRGRGRGRNFGGFNDRDENRQNDRNRSRSRSPVKRAPPAQERRSYSRSRSPSGSPKKTKSPSPPKTTAPRQTRERSYSGSDRSD